MALTLTIDRTLEDPVYEQVAGQVRQLVASGALSPGTTLPPVRQLARDLGVGLNTIARAYRRLEAEGFIVLRDRSGATIAEPMGVDQPVRARLLDQLRTTLARLRQSGMAADELLQVISMEIRALGSSPEETQND
jgi:DNA-binding transcriptional regulator YhcF (GntR family)|tara:strand:+ start:2875 stop:3279 length:405 start_codon:yes stop_codon:yes gene_type:complete